MTERFRLTLAQLNPTVGALDRNAEMARVAWQQGRDAGADMVALTEMFITGYQTRDLVMKPAFHRDAIATIERLAQDCADGPALGVGGPWWDGERLYNAYHVLHGGKVVGAPAALPDPDQRAHHRAHLAVQERARRRDDPDFGTVAEDVELVERLFRRFRLALRIAERGEVVLAHEALRGRMHGIAVEPTRHAPDAPDIEREVRAGIGNAIEVVAPDGGKARLEIVWHDLR